MKLLIVHNTYQSNNIGGEDIVFRNELSLLEKKLGKENIFSYEVSNDNINKIELLFNIWFSRKHYNNIEQIIKKNNIDIVHIHNFFPLLTPSIFKSAKKNNVKVIHTLHNYRLWCISGILFRDGFGICEKCVNNKFSLSGIKNKCYRNSLLQSFVAQSAFGFYKMTKVFDNIDYFFVLTNFQKEKVQSLGIDKNKIVLKPNSLNTNLNIKKDKKNYIYVGRLEESKGIYKLLKSWNNLDEKYILTIIGGGNIEKELKEKYNKKNIIFKGKCTREETIKSISFSKYLIQPSILYETFGLTIIEAMSCGVPVIGYNIGTRGDLIKDNLNGFLCNDDDLVKIIEKSYINPTYEEMSKEAKISADLYENNNIIEKQIKIYKSILEKKI